MNAWPHTPTGVGGSVVSHKKWVTRLLHGIIWPSPRFNPAMERRRERVSDRHDRISSIVTCIQFSAAWQPCGERGDAVCNTSHYYCRASTTAGSFHRANKGSRYQAKTAHLPSHARHSPLPLKTI